MGRLGRLHHGLQFIGGSAGSGPLFTEVGPEGKIDILVHRAGVPFEGAPQDANIYDVECWAIERIEAWLTRARNTLAVAGS